ncbi:MAG: adenylyl-sulfate reductase [Gammaproteobacteria bacterium]|nr:adenylyl-sulfate reductase [Gammaproteobacteria bacterium]
MFTSNPFAELSAWISPSVMQTYIVVMIILVAIGTIYDVLHKKSAKYFRANMQKSKAEGTSVGGGEMISMAIKTAVVDVAASGEFCNPRRRIAHLLTMYGFIAFAVTTAIMVFRYPTPDVATPAILVQLWWLGAAMVCIGGYWFWFYIRADVAAEGSSPFRIMRADLFILSLLGSATFALIWAYLQARGHAWATPAFWLHVLATTLLFGSVPWSKFAHMFFKPAAAFEKRISVANGTRSNLPAPADQPERFGSVDHRPRNY